MEIGRTEVNTTPSLNSLLHKNHRHGLFFPKVLGPSVPVSELSAFQPFLSKQSQSDKYFVRQVGQCTWLVVPFLRDVAFEYLTSLGPSCCLLTAKA